MISYLIRRVLYAMPIMLGVAFLCFMLVHIAPGDPLVAILPPDASVDLQKQLMELYGFNRSYPEQFFSWVWRAMHGDLGSSIATGRPVAQEVFKAVGNTFMIAALATLIGFFFGSLFGFVAGYFRNSWVDKIASFISVVGVSVPHYWLGMVLVVADILSQEFVIGLKARGLGEFGVFRHVVKNCAPTAMAVMGLQLGYLLGGSILIETVFSWPGTGFLLNQAIFQRDLPLLQGTILVLALFFVSLNLLVDILQTVFDPRIERA
ncbi:ABC transporter permease [Herbaspirillum lusitanum]|uniref:ABC transporter permease n=1 Tax=Herbaspirillum lusitanum TaxID=213312 RepID=UPI0002EC97AF|nr:ABC transporter permease [Herbaspirillum lusitanum]